MKLDPTDLTRAEIERLVGISPYYPIETLVKRFALPELPEPDYVDGGQSFWWASRVKAWAAQFVPEFSQALTRLKEESAASSARLEAARPPLSDEELEAYKRLAELLEQELRERRERGEIP